MHYTCHENNLMKHLSLLTVLCLISCTSLACTHRQRLGQFTSASTFNVRGLNYSNVEGKSVRVKGSSCLKTILSITFGDGQDRLQRAMDNAIRKGQELNIDGDLLVNVRIDQVTSGYIIGSTNCIVVEGDLVRLRK